MVVDCLRLLPVGPLLPPAGVLDGSEEDDLAEGDQLAHDQPDVDHLDRRGGRQPVHLADEDGRHDQHRR